MQRYEFFSYELQVTSYKLQVTSYKLRGCREKSYFSAIGREEQIPPVGINDGVQGK